jgi:phage tail sheath protein FI
MPVTPTYPGVYIEEIPSGVRTITGVATSITALIGRALRGPTDTAVTINSYADFERNFGGLWVDSSLGYAVRDFYLNGGSQAIIVRLYNPETGNNAKAAKAKVSAGSVQLEAANEGAWGANLRASVDTDVTDAIAQLLGLTKADLFNLTVRDASPGGTTERYLNLTFKDSPRRIDKVLQTQSSLVHWDSAVTLDPTNPPAIAAADDSVTTAEKQLATAKQQLATAQQTIPPDQNAINTAKQAVADAQTAVDAAKKALADAVSDGLFLTKANFTPAQGEQNKKGLFALEQADLFNLLCIPPYLSPVSPLDVDVTLVADAGAYCEKRRAMLLVDPPKDWADKTAAVNKFKDTTQDNVGTRSKNGALFFPRLRQPNPLHDNQIEDFVPCGAVAGIFARTDTQRGVWKAPAGLDATLTGVPQLSVPLTDAENGELNPLGVNCLRALPAIGRVVWGARTLQGDDRLASEWKYIPVRRTALFIEESLYRGTQWVVFEPNDEPLWAQIRLNLGAFMNNLFRQGAFQGKTPREAYFVKCDKETTTQNDINLGIVNILVGFAPLKPAEFVIIQLQQMAGQVEV